MKAADVAPVAAVNESPIAAITSMSPGHEEREGEREPLVKHAPARHQQLHHLWAFLPFALLWRIHSTWSRNSNTAIQQQQ